MMIFLGNLSLEDVVKEKDLEIIREFLKKNRFKHTQVTDEVKDEEGNYHIYDIPRVFVICGETKAKEFVEFLQDNNLVKDSWIGTLQIAIEQPRIK